MEKLPCRPRKTVTLPVSGNVDITSVRKVVDTPLFQRLRRCIQLGEVRTVYPDAGHTRLSHCLGTKKWTGRRMQRLCEWQQADIQDLRDAEMFGLLHDIGHGPRSHLTDSLVRVGHEERAVALLDGLSSRIADCNANPDRVIAMMKREDPLHEVVTNTPLGTDKLDYLARDAYHTGIQGMPAEGVYLDNVYFIEGKLVADAKIFGECQLLQAFYKMMYDRVYYRTAVVVTERFEQRMMSVQLGQTNDEPEYTEDELVAMTDSDLDYHLSHSVNETVRKEYQRLMEREQAYPAIVFQHPPYEQHNWAGRHPMTYWEAPDGILDSKNLADPRVLYRLERTLEGELGMPFHSILAAAPVPARRFLPKQIHFLTDSGVVSSEEMAPELWAAQVHEAKRHAAFYICAYLEDCPRLANSDTARVVAEIVGQFA